MCNNNFDDDVTPKYCSYCHSGIIGEGYIYIEETGEYFHHSKTNPLNNCYFPNGEVEELNFD